MNLIASRAVNTPAKCQKGLKKRAQGEVNAPQLCGLALRLLIALLSTHLLEARQLIERRFTIVWLGRIRF